MNIPWSRVAWAVVIVAWVLALGFFAVLAEGIVPRTPRQILLALFVAGPVLVMGEVLLEGACFGIGLAALWLLTLGCARLERRDETNSFPWYGVSRLSDGSYVASGEALALIGFAMLVMVVTVGIVFYARTS